jgi:hypothetical protein
VKNFKIRKANRLGGSGPSQASYLLKNGAESDREGGGRQYRGQQPKEEKKQLV